MTMPLAMALRYHAVVDTLHLGEKTKSDTPAEMNALDAIPGHVNDRNSVSSLYWRVIAFVHKLTIQNHAALGGS